jgi:hypothetical protein
MSHLFAQNCSQVHVSPSQVEVAPSVFTAIGLAVTALPTQIFPFLPERIFLVTAQSNLDGAGAVEIFRAEKIGVVADNSSRTCRLCGEKMKLVRTMLNSDTGNITHLFECPCGKRTWDD